MWTNQLRNRMHSFRAAAAEPDPGAAAVSIKVRVTSGCFHRDHSPQAYALIDDALHRVPPTDRPFQFLEHESGPEILVYVAAATAGISLAKSVIDLLVAVLKARSEGVKKGDRPAEPLEVVVRRSIDPDRVDEELVVRVGHTDGVKLRDLNKALLTALEKLLDADSTQGRTPGNKTLQPRPARSRRRKPKGRGGSARG
jgi:hypothetical protein